MYIVDSNSETHSQNCQQTKLTMLYNMYYLSIPFNTLKYSILYWKTTLSIRITKTKINRFQNVSIYYYTMLNRSAQHSFCSCGTPRRSPGRRYLSGDDVTGGSGAHERGAAGATRAPTCPLSVGGLRTNALRHN